MSIKIGRRIQNAIFRAVTELESEEKTKQGYCMIWVREVLMFLIEKNSDWDGR
jgi:hypothetical protein